MDRAIFGISVLLGFVASGLALRLFLWPYLLRIPRLEALRALTALHMFRFIGLGFLVPGVVSPSLPAAFAVPAAYGDLVACILAIFATAALSMRAKWAESLVWLLVFQGAADLLFAYYQGVFGVGISPGALGAAFFVPTVIVPVLLISHLMMAILLLRKPQLTK
jgi:hypothetical protein